MGMFCFQCQEAAKGVGCQIKGVCGKTDDVANLQDLLIFVLKGISVFSSAARSKGIVDDVTDKFVFDGLFATITNANFSKKVFIERIQKGLVIREKMRQKAEAAGVVLANLPEAATWTAASEDEIVQRSLTLNYLQTESNDDIRALKALTEFGLKGMAAYAEHAWNLGYKSDSVYHFMQRGLAELTRTDITVDELVALTLETGKYGVDVMALLDKANTESFGHPEISKVNIGTGSRPGILVSGHDLKDLIELLEQSEGQGIDIYTHSEMLPAHYYPKLKQYKHLVGNYGSSWWHQKEEFATFNGPILFTTNCLVPPAKDAVYANKVFTTGAAGFDGFPHIADRENGQPKDFSAIIEMAKKCEVPQSIEQGEIVGGFAHEQVFALADKVVDAVKSGAIRKFIVMAGCDGRMPGRAYYSQFAEKLPKDTVILTAGCAKYRYNKLPLGDINGIPRVLDAGQCNDSYSLALIALKLKEVFNLADVNELPIAYNIAWYEQKAVIVLLALLHLGVKNIHLGPTLPAFLSPNVVNVLVENFGIGGVSTVDEDIALMA
jgi:hydroxylamine reductase